MMQITVIGDEIRVDGSTVGAIWGGPRKEREALRDALRNAPEVEYANGVGWFGELGDDDDEPATIATNEDQASDVRAEAARALAALKKHRPAEALEILTKALD